MDLGGRSRQPRSPSLTQPGLRSVCPDFRWNVNWGAAPFSRVFLARQQGLANRLVVLKISTECFAEADKMARLQHAHIVPVYSVHAAGDLFAICMPYFGAATLADLISGLGGGQTLPPSGRIVADTITARAASTHVADWTAAPLLATSDKISAQSDLPNPSTPEACSFDATTYLKTLQGLSYVDAVLSMASVWRRG